MKKLVLLRENPNAFGGAELYLKWIKENLAKHNLTSDVRGFNGNQKIASWLKALLFNSQVRKQKSNDELYFSLARIDSADIYRTADGVHKFFRQTKTFWYFNPLNFVLPYLEKKCFENAKCIIAISQMVKNQIVQFYNIDANKIQVLHNGINFPSCIDKISAKNEICAEFGLKNDLPLILYVGSGFQRKGVADIIWVLRNVKTPYNAIFVGKDKKLNYYQNLAKKFAVNAKFVGARTDVKRFFEAADIFMLLANYEPFGISALEAMSYQNAVITSENCGVSELLDANFVAKNKENAYEILQNLLQDKKYLQQVAEKNRKISRNCSLEKNIATTLEIIKKYL